MASAAITIVENPATIESDTNEAIITKDANLPQLAGVLSNASLIDTFLSFSVSAAAAAAVATTNAQAQKIIPLPAGASVPWLPHYSSCKHKTAAGAAVLSWTPGHKGKGD